MLQAHRRPIITTITATHQLALSKLADTKPLPRIKSRHMGNRKLADTCARDQGDGAMNQGKKGNDGHRRATIDSITGEQVPNDCRKRARADESRRPTVRIR